MKIHVWKQCCATRAMKGGKQTIWNYLLSINGKNQNNTFKNDNYHFLGQQRRPYRPSPPTIAEEVPSVIILKVLNAPHCLNMSVFLTFFPNIPWKKKPRRLLVPVKILLNYIGCANFHVHLMILSINLFNWVFLTKRQFIQESYDILDFLYLNIFLIQFNYHVISPHIHSLLYPADNFSISYQQSLVGCFCQAYIS